jgi:hypothetical protein
LLVQATGLPHVGDRMKRIQGGSELPALLSAGIVVEVWGWCRRGRRWQVKRLAVRAADLAAVPVEVLPRKARTPRQRGLFDGMAVEAP